MKNLYSTFLWLVDMVMGKINKMGRSLESPFWGMTSPPWQTTHTCHVLHGAYLNQIIHRRIAFICSQILWHVSIKRWRAMKAIFLLGLFTHHSQRSFHAMLFRKNWKTEWGTTSNHDRNYYGLLWKFRMKPGLRIGTPNEIRRQRSLDFQLKNVYGKFWFNDSINRR